MKTSKELKTSSAAISRICYFCNLNKSNEKLDHCLNCKRLLCQQCINTSDTRKVIIASNEDKKEEQYVCSLCKTKEIQCNHCYSTNDLIKFSSIENMFDYIKEMGEYREEYDFLKTMLIEEKMLIDLFICKKCLNAIDFQKTDLVEYLALFGLTKSMTKNKSQLQWLQSKPKTNNNKQFNNVSSLESNAIDNKNDDKKISNKASLDGTGSNSKECVVVNETNSVQIDNVNKEEKQSDMKQEANIKYAINHQSDSDSEKYASLYKDIRNQIDVMKYCNKLHQTSIESLTNYLEVYDKYLTEQMNLNNINEDYLNRIEQDIGGGGGQQQILNHNNNNNTNNQTESVSHISDKQGNNNNNTSIPYNPFIVPINTMNNNPLQGIPNPQFQHLYNPPLNMTQPSLFNPILQPDPILNSINNNNTSPNPNPIPIPKYNQANP